MAFGSPYYGGQQYPAYQPPQAYGQQYQPMQAQPPQMSQPTGLNRVTGIEGARAFQVNPNSVVALFDDTQDVFYVKSTDSGGFPTIRGYRFTPIEDAPQVQSAGLTRADIEQIVREEISKYEQQSLSANRYTVPTEHRGGNTAGHDAGVRELHAGNAGAQPTAVIEQSHEQRQRPAGCLPAGTADGTAV